MKQLRCPKCLRRTVRLAMPPPIQGERNNDSYYCIWRKWKREGGCDWYAYVDSYDRSDHEQMAALRAANPEEAETP